MHHPSLDMVEHSLYRASPVKCLIDDSTFIETIIVDIDVGSTLERTFKCCPGL